jgi:predicted porin
MKRSLLALAVLSAFAGAASAQSSVTLSGSVDAGLKRVGTVINNNKAITDWQVGGSQSGYNNFTLSGIEDLGGGSRAFFSLNHRFNIGNGADNGFTNGGGVGTTTSTGNATPIIAEPFWRMAWVGLGTGFGEVRIGRIQMPLQDMNGGFDPFGTGTVGSTHTGGVAATVRANNAVYYKSPSLGGLTVHLAGAAGDGQLNNTEIGSGSSANPRGFFGQLTRVPSERPIGLNVRYAAGPVNVGAAYDKNAADMKTVGVYGSFDFGAAKVMAQFEKGDNYTSAGTASTSRSLPNEKIKAFSIGLTAPLGPVVLRTGFLKIKSDLTNRDASKFGFGGDYNLSKRTNLYTTVGKWSGNRLASFPAPSTVTTPAGLAAYSAAYSEALKKAQFDFGVTHRF